MIQHAVFMDVTSIRLRYYYLEKRRKPSLGDIRMIVEVLYMLKETINQGKKSFWYIFVINVPVTIL